MYSIYKNIKILKNLNDKDYRLLQFDKKLNNIFYIYLLYSLIPDEINKLNLKDLNLLGDLFKKNLNKFVKNKFNKNYINPSIKKDLDIFADLLNLNISIYTDRFDNLYSVTNNSKYKKRLYFLSRDKELYILIKKNKNEFKLQLQNNVLKSIQSGGVKRRRNTVETPAKIPARRDADIKFIKKWTKYKETKIEAFNKMQQLFENFSDAINNKSLDSYQSIEDRDIRTPKEFFYNSTEFSQFLLKYITKLFDKQENRLDIVKELTIATFTNNYRKNILDYISTIENELNQQLREHRLFQDNINQIGIAAVIVVAGGSGFNNLISEEYRIVSPDIDVKLCLQTDQAIELHNIIMNDAIDINQHPNITALKMIVSSQLLIIRKTLYNILYNLINDRINKELFSSNNVNIMNQMYTDLHERCVDLLNNSKHNDIPSIHNIRDILINSSREAHQQLETLNNKSDEDALADKKGVFSKRNVNEIDAFIKTIQMYINNDGTIKSIPYLDVIGNVAKNGYKKVFDPNQSNKVLIRHTIMNRGIVRKNISNQDIYEPYKLHDVHLYALDLCFHQRSSFESIAGLLDIVISQPGHIGFMVGPYDHPDPDYTNKQFEGTNTKNITFKYFIHESEKLIDYLLRTKKLLKDVKRLIVIYKIESNRENKKYIITLLHKIQETIGRNPGIFDNQEEIVGIIQEIRDIHKNNKNTTLIDDGIKFITPIIYETDIRYLNDNINVRELKEKYENETIDSILKIEKEEPESLSQDTSSEQILVTKKDDINKMIFNELIPFQDLTGQRQRGNTRGTRGIQSSQKPQQKRILRRAESINRISEHIDSYPDHAIKLVNKNMRTRSRQSGGIFGEENILYRFNLIEPLSISKLLYYMCNNKSILPSPTNLPPLTYAFNPDNQQYESIEDDNIREHDINFNKLNRKIREDNDVSEVNFEKLIKFVKEYRETNDPNRLGESAIFSDDLQKSIFDNNNNIYTEYMSTKCEYRLKPFKITQSYPTDENVNIMEYIDELCRDLIKTICRGGINKLCYGYEGNDMIANNSPHHQLEENDIRAFAPTMQEYAQLLLTDCHVLNMKSYAMSSKMSKMLEENYENYLYITPLYNYIRYISNWNGSDDLFNIKTIENVLNIKFNV